MKISIPLPSHASLHGGGFEAGFMHPVLGFDHLLAMVAVGIISVMIGKKAIYLVPLAFVSIMVLGALSGFYKYAFLDNELAIGYSVLLLGLAISVGKKLPLWFVLLLVAFFAYFHGHAHGLEIPKMTSKLEYIGGFVVATISLHLVGLGLAHFADKWSSTKTVLHHTGSAIAGIGFYILFIG